MYFQSWIRRTQLLNPTRNFSIICEKIKFCKKNCNGEIWSKVVLNARNKIRCTQTSDSKNSEIKRHWLNLLRWYTLEIVTNIPGSRGAWRMQRGCLSFQILGCSNTNLSSSKFGLGWQPEQSNPNRLNRWNIKLLKVAIKLLADTVPWM